MRIIPERSNDKIRKVRTLNPGECRIQDELYHTVNSGHEVKSVGRHPGRTVDEYANRSRRMIKPRPRRHPSFSRQRERQVGVSDDTDVGINEVGSGQRHRRELYYTSPEEPMSAKEA
jgi:hypothetical protein